MKLNDIERRMADGDLGSQIQKAIGYLIELGRSFDAEKLVPVSRAHISYDACPVDFWDMLTEGLEKTEHRVTTHPAFQPQQWKEWGLPLADRWLNDHNHRVDTIQRLGWLLTETCAEYQIGISAQKGDVVSMGGSCIQVSNNSLFGARVDRMGILISLAAAVCGRTPLMGLLLQENRYAKYLVEPEGLDFQDWDATRFQCFGYYIGSQVPGFQPVAVNNIPRGLPFELSRALVIPLPTSGAVTLCHIIGTTPEAPDLESALGNKKPEHVIRVGEKEMQQTYEKLNVWENKEVEHVCFGCPHASIDEIGRIAAMLEGKTIKTSLLIGASDPVREFARKQGWTDIIEKAGGHISPVCPALVNPFVRKDIAGHISAGSAATNSARAAHYLASVNGINVFLGSERECVDAAITGQWNGGMPKWS